MTTATEDERYRQSTQFRLWSYSPAQLADLRAKTNSLARQNISERLSSMASSSFLSPAEEQHLLRFYTVETLRAAEFCQLPTEIRATAAIFLRRFFVTHSVMTYPPAKMLKTCVFFGAKAENVYPRVSTIANKFPNTTGEEILAGEFLLCQGIRFAFDVRHPFIALEGTIMQLRTFGDVDDARIKKAHSRAREILKFSPIVTDAYFHYTPSQIMLAALSIADHGLFERVMEATFTQRLPTESGTSTPSSGANAKGAGPHNSALVLGQMVKEKTLATVQACKEMLLQEPPERMTEYWGTAEASNLVKPINKKLRRCRDPDRFDLIGLHKKRLEFREKETASAKGAAEDDGAVFGGSIEALKGSADRESKRRRVAGDDPFGPPL
ncbi:cyclin-like protein [Cryphonectria parasitica EP155]|uniref:Cyclin-like protein n=1 Tax=Cryphonectria parasitica (strain ATCC 38755 / EP155) TaxID=660469 RepID=A0A9P5CHV1_CRYP1|nr:cyclin-like protein [Cryphonectria parasitica EP155]KAF3760339.1 cyclin-like protein [Cryphonectria parasitica EP155]